VGELWENCGRVRVMESSGVVGEWRVMESCGRDMENLIWRDVGELWESCRRVES